MSSARAPFRSSASWVAAASAPASACASWRTIRSWSITASVSPAATTSPSSTAIRRMMPGVLAVILTSSTSIVPEARSSFSRSPPHPAPRISASINSKPVLVRFFMSLICLLRIGLAPLAGFEPVKHHIENVLFPLLDERLQIELSPPEYLDHRKCKKDENARRKERDGGLQRVNRADFSRTGRPYDPLHENTRRRVLNVPDDFLHHFSEHRSPFSQLSEEKADQVRAGVDEVDVAIDAEPEHLLERCTLAHGVAERSDRPMENVAKNLPVEPVLAAEVVVQHRLVDAGLVRDGLHPCAVLPLTAEDLQCGAEDPVFRLGVRFRRRRFHRFLAIHSRYSSTFFAGRGEYTEK